MARAITDVEQLIADTLGIPRASITTELAFGEIPEWDSLGHVDLMLALEDALDTTVNADQMVALMTVGAIRQYAEAA